MYCRVQVPTAQMTHPQQAIPDCFTFDRVGSLRVGVGPVRNLENDFAYRYRDQVLLSITWLSVRVRT